MRQPIKFNPYQKPTVELVLKLLGKAYEDDKKIAQMLEEMMETFEKEMRKDLSELIEKDLLDLDKKINLENHPRLYAALKEVERKELHRFIDWCWMGAQVIKESMMRTYKDTVATTYIIYNRPNISKGVPEIQIRDFHIEQTAIKIPWCQDGKIYSDRLYSHVKDFQRKLTFVLEQGIRKGKGYDWMVSAWRKLTKSTLYEAERLIKTETMAMWSKATKETLLSIGVEFVEIVGDAICGGICLDYAGEAIPLREAEIGDHLPPYHPNCACSFVEYVEQVEIEKE